MISLINRNAVKLMGMVLALLMGGQFSLAQAPAKTGKDAETLKAANAIFDNVKHEKLPNGLNVYLKPIPGAPTVTTMVAYKVGSADENLDQTGLSHYLEHLMFKGTEKLMPGDIDRFTLRNGGANNAYTSEDCTVYHFDFSADRWEQALAIEADRMRNLLIDDKHEFQQEKGAVIEELKRNEDGPWDLEYKAIMPKIFGANAPYGHPVIGQAEHVKASTALTIKAHYDLWYHPSNASLVICGGFDPAQAMARVKELFGNIPAGELPARKVNVPLKREGQIRIEMKSKFEVARLLIAFNTVEMVDEDAPALSVLEAVLSDGKISRFYRKFIEGEELASVAAAESSTGRYPGWFGIQMELMQGKDGAKLEKMIFDELDKLANELVSDEELERIRQKILAGAVFSRESVHGLADVISRTVVVADLEYLKSYLSKLLAVSPADLQRVAKKYLVKDKSVVLWSIPEKGAKTSSNHKPEKNRRLFRQKEQAAVTPFSLTKAKRIELPSGTVLLLMPDSKVPVLVANIAIRESKGYETSEKQGVASMTGSLLDEGIPGLDGPQLALKIEGVGGELEFDESGGALKVLSHHGKMGIDLLLNCMRSPTFPKDAFERNKEQTLSSLQDLESQANFLAKREFLKEVYGDHPRGRSAIGTIKSVKALTNEDCIAFHKLCYHPANLIISVVGDFDAAEVEAQIREGLKGWPVSEAAKINFPKVAMLEKFTQKIISNPEAVQMQFYMGHVGIRRNDPDYFKLLVMDYILGTGPGFTDRLSARLRDREGLAYTVNANITSTADIEPGVFTCYIGTDAVNFERVKKEFLEELERIRTTNPTEDELSDAKNYLLGSLAFRFTTNAAIASQLLMTERLGVGLDYLDKFRKEVSAVTGDDIKAVAFNHIQTDKLLLLAVGAIDQTGKLLPKK